MEFIVKLDQPDPPQDPWSATTPGGSEGPPVNPPKDPWTTGPGGRHEFLLSDTTPPLSQNVLSSSQNGWGGTPGGPNGNPQGKISPNAEASMEKIVDTSQSSVLSDDPPPPPPTSQDPVNTTPGGPIGNPHGATPPSLPGQTDRIVDTPPSSAIPDQQPTTPQQTASTGPWGTTPGGSNGSPHGDIPPSQEDAKVKKEPPSSTPSGQQSLPSTSNPLCSSEGPSGPPSGGILHPLEKVAKPSASSTPSFAPAGIQQPLTTWRQAFPKNPGLYVHIKTGEPVDIRVSPPLQQQPLVELANFQTLASYPATPVQRLALEAYLLDSQLRGLSALASRMNSDLDGTDPAMSDVQKQLKHITALLHIANDVSYTLYRDVYLANTSPQSGQSKETLVKQ